ncbi:MAG: HlyD family efflux transporter periplasmic adaptor subunit [Planctomycetes bacterium]|nr:HlyD family efflux transporter periplasmic adaptor subunit [Planctomycetota bacterium]
MVVSPSSRAVFGSATVLLLFAVAPLSAQGAPHSEPALLTLAGQVEPLGRQVLRSRLPGEAIVLWLAPEGQLVRKGDRVAELDVTPLREELATREIDVARALSDVIEAEAAVELHARDIRIAELEAGILVAAAEVELWTARDALERARREAGEGGEETAALRLAQGRVQLAELRLELAKLRAPDLVAAAEAGRAVARAKVDERRAGLDLARERVEMLEEAIASRQVLAPVDGMVFHTPRSHERVSAGSVVRERQAVVEIVDPTRRQVAALVHADDVATLRTGHAAEVVIPGPTDRRVAGRVSRVASLPVSGTEDGPAAARQFQVVIELDGEQQGLTIGTTATVRIQRGQPAGRPPIDPRARDPQRRR